MPEPINAKIVRMYVDGELAADEAARFERRLEGDPQLQRQVATEQALRDNVARVMQFSAPRELAERVLSVMSAASSEASAAATTTPPQRPQHHLGQRARSTLPQPSAPQRRWFLGPQRVNVFAVAACLLLVAGAVLVGIYGRPIDQLRLQPPADTAAAELLEFAQREHKRSGDPTESEKECVAHSPAEAVATLRHNFGLEVGIPDFSAKGYQFDGLAICDWHGEQVPKLKYRVPPAPGQRSPRFCIFISKDLDNLDCSTGRLPGCAKKGDHRVWQDHGLVYLMTACKPLDLAQAYELLHGESLSPAR